MKEQEFKKWLLEKKYEESACRNRISNCKNVEKYYLDLDEQYSKDRCENLMSILSYSTADERAKLPPQHIIPINGDIRTGSATLKQAVKRYVEFRDEMQSVIVEIKPKFKEKEIIDGLDFLVDILFEEKDFIQQIISAIYFIDKESVECINKKLISDYKSGKKLPVRFSQKDSAYIKQNDVRKTTYRFENRKEAVSKTREDSFYSSLRNDESKILIVVDSDGNQAVRKNIKEKTGHVVSYGEQSTVINSMLCHVWDKTNDPLYFSLLWNITIIPLSLAFITDKNEDSLYKDSPNDRNKKLIKTVKNLIKAIAIKLYNPNAFFEEFGIKEELKEDLSVGSWTHETMLNLADKLIQNGDVRFLSKR